MNESLSDKMPARNASSIAGAGGKAYAPVILRTGLSLVFLWFGSQQLLHTSMWIGMIPNWVTSLSGLSAASLVHFNGAFEIVFGICLFLGYFTRVSALLLALHMLHITLTVGYNQIGVRDFGLSLAMISVFLYGADIGSLDSFLTTPKGEQAKNM